MNELVVQVENKNGILVTTSNRVASELGVNHRDLLEKIDGYIKRFGVAELSADFYIPSNYVHLQNKQTYRNYLITEKGVAQLIGGYSAAVSKAFDLNVAYINKFEEMKKYIQGNFKIPKTFSEALRLAAEKQEKIERLENKLEEQAPLVGFAETIEKTSDCILVREFSKILGNENIHLGEKKLYKWLRKNGYIMKDSTEPYQSAIEKGLFMVSEKTIKTVRGELIIKTTKITGKGQIILLQKLKKEF